MTTIFRPAAVLLACVTALLAAGAAVNDRVFESASAAGAAAAVVEPAVVDQPVAASSTTNVVVEPANPAIAELQRRVAKLDAETNELRQRLSALAVPASASPAAIDPSAQAGSRPARRDAPPPAGEMQAADRALAESREAAFRDETLDARWSTATLAKLQQALSAGDNGAPALRSAECRSRTCRLEIGAADPQQLDAFMPGFANRIATTLGSIAASPVDTADGTQAMVLYLSR